jgi:protein-S-isoprenylcysteine O-methyltransferase Ste14
MPPFDPFSLAAKFLPERRLHLLIRLAVFLILLAFAALRIRQYPDFLLKPLWFVETLIYLVLAAAYLTRGDPVDRARGWREIAVPLVGALLPFGLLASPPHPWVAAKPQLLQIVFGWMTAATALTVWGVLTLRRAFSITVEARTLVTGGPYRWVRHPIYLGEILASAAVCAWRFSPVNLFILVAFAAIQVLRAKAEEEKLARNFPGYRALRRSWWPF